MSYRLYSGISVKGFKDLQCLLSCVQLETCMYLLMRTPRVQSGIIQNGIPKTCNCANGNSQVMETFSYIKV